MAEVADNFDWDNVGATGFGGNYSPEQRAEMEKMYGDTLTTVQEEEVVKGTVVGITDRDVILNIGFKSDGLVPLSEFRDLVDLKIGDQVEVFIEDQEDLNGQLILSRKKAKIKQAWKSIYDALEFDNILEGVVKRRTKGGLIMELDGVEAFLPGSQIDVKPIRDFDIYVGRRMEVKVVKINAAFDNVVVSHKVLIEKDLEKQREAILNNLEKGQILEGVIKNMTNFGVFIDLGGVDGLLHITDISWGRIAHPSEVLQLDQKLNVVVLDFDEAKKRISLGLKQLTPHPWDSLPADMGVGSKVKGRIVNVADYGAFMEIVPGVEGLIHVSEMSWSQHLRNPQDFIKQGDVVEAQILTLDREDRKMSLGIKQLSEDPWTRGDFGTKYAVGTKHNGLVRNLTNFGLFVELEEGVDGLVHVSDLSWTKKIKHPSEMVKVGDRLDVLVLELDVSNRRLALGHKQLEENPWDTFQTVFTPGSVHKATITEKNDRGAVLELPYGIEGFAYPKSLVKEDGSNAENGEALDFRVVEFSKDDRRIVLSHTAVFNQAQQEEDTRNSKFAKKKPAAGQTAGAAQGEGKLSDLKKPATADKSTLGDLDALSALRDKMMGNERDAGVQKLEAKAPKAAKAEEAPAAEAPEADTTEEAPAAEGGILAAVTGAASAAFEKAKEVAGDVVDTVADSAAFEKAKEVAGDVVEKAKDLLPGNEEADKKDEEKV
ncbi:SSU ribosomal protein S1P [Hymenobacter roseosalivarius DSM 11622]|uniref:Small ribosomal subunit protein bS1 n=1 Tax=Hymenobacter roseosalivarius DSM 11622 TaxID=645990 RepID=A0A1W1VWX2_9BACT|nr:30S ribosomal protein S1 [Hymenobacter roseosalivarius]SMB97611.1 SSU ribosomal protein S1P [Hymenobacter roseosalivarius DSM 11622]